MTFFQAENLTINFGGIRAVDDVSFAVSKGEVFTIIGPNGAGKTTIFNLVSRIYEPTAGRLFSKAATSPRCRHTGLPTAASRAPSRTSSCSSTPRCCRICCWRATCHRRAELLRRAAVPAVACGAMEVEHREAVEKVIDFLDLQQYRDALIVNLPYGVRKVAELARALCTDPKLLLLDEPSSGLNVEETEDMAFWIEDIKKLLGITVLMVEHDMKLVAAVSDRVLALNYGRPLATGTPHEVQSHPEVIRAYLGG